MFAPSFKIKLERQKKAKLYFVSLHTTDEQIKAPRGQMTYPRPPKRIRT